MKKMMFLAVLMAIAIPCLCRSKEQLADNRCRQVSELASLEVPHRVKIPEVPFVAYGTCKQLACILMMLKLLRRIMVQEF